MALQVCKNCTTRYAPAAVCPQCGGDVWISEAQADELAAPMTGTGHPADGTMSPDAGSDGDGGEPGEQVVQLPDGGDEDGPPDYMAYRVTDLRELARDCGLPVTGSKAELAAALTAYDAEHQAAM